MIIREESPGDTEQVLEVVQRAFLEAPHSSQTEAMIVAELRKAGALSLSLVAEQNGCIVGHLALSPVSISDGSLNWYGLGPVAVEPARQNQGIGSAMIRKAIQHLEAISAEGCVVLGEPGYYSRFGFRPRAQLHYPGPPAEYFQAWCAEENMALGEVRYHQAFLTGG